MRRILALAALLAAGNAHAEGFRVPRPLPKVVGKSADEAEKLVGAGSKRVAGEKARAACGDTCSEVAVWGGGAAPGSAATVESAFLFLENGGVRSARWVFEGTTGKPESYPRLDEFLTSVPGEGRVTVISATNRVRKNGVSDEYVKDLLFAVDGDLWTAMVLCPLLPVEDGGSRRSTFPEYRVVQIKVGGQPLWRRSPPIPRAGWKREALHFELGAPVARLTGDRAREHCESCDSVEIWGPAGVASSAFSNVTVYAHLVGDELVGARWVCAPVSEPTRFSYPSVMEVVEQQPADDRPKKRGKKDPDAVVREWTVSGAAYKADLECGRIKVWTKENGLHEATATLPRCRAREVSWTRVADGPADEGASVARIPDIHDLPKSPVLLYDPEPVYPLRRADRGQSGMVVFEMIVGKDGKVEEITIVSGDSIFVETTVQAFSKWRYEPVVLESGPTAWKQRYTMRYEFIGTKR